MPHEMARVEALRLINHYVSLAQDQYFRTLSTGDRAMIASAKESWDRVRAEREEVRSAI